MQSHLGYIRKVCTGIWAVISATFLEYHVPGQSEQPVWELDGIENRDRRNVWLSTHTAVTWAPWAQGTWLIGMWYLQVSAMRRHQEGQPTEWRPSWFQAGVSAKFRFQVSILRLHPHPTSPSAPSSIIKPRSISVSLAKDFCNLKCSFTSF